MNIYKDPQIDWEKIRQFISDKLGKQYSQSFIKEVWKKQKTSTPVKNILIELEIWKYENNTRQSNH